MNLSPKKPVGEPRALVTSTRYNKDLKREFGGISGKEADRLDKEIRDVLGLLSIDAVLPAKYLDHPLKNRAGIRDLHIRNDLVLLYKKEDKPKRTLCLIRMGSHSEIF